MREESQHVLRCVALGRVPYLDAVDLQRSLLARRAEGQAPDTLLLLEHPHVYTLGRRARDSDVLADAAALQATGAEVARTDRGGETTYHGPGQLVAYPILGLHWLGMGPVGYVRLLETAIIETLACYGLAGHTVDGSPGVWVGGDGAAPADGVVPAGRKIAAIGVKVSRGVSMHGLALNVSTDLSYFTRIVPCGMPGLPVTSISEETGRAVDTHEVGASFARVLAAALGLDLVTVDSLDLAHAD
ncbi:MAG: lipoyl(octanoyl) transferase LipB [Chloroflexota bacterium]